MQVSKIPFAVLAAIAFVAGPAVPASAQTWPNRFVTMIVPFPAGGAADVVARAVANELSDQLGQQFVIENRAGGSGNIGAAQVARAAPDGYTLIFATPSPLANNKFMYKNLPFDPERDFTPIVLVSKLPSVVVTNPASPLKNLQGLIAAAKAKPGKLNIGTPGHGTIGHITSELLQTVAGIKLSNVPYRGSPQIITDVLGNQVDVALDFIPLHIPLVIEGKLRALAVTGSRRAANWPDVPTVQELGFPGFEATAWTAMLAPTGTPSDIIRKINAVVNAYLQSEKGRKQLAVFEMEPAGGTPEQLRSFIASEIAKWEPVIRAANISME